MEGNARFPGSFIDKIRSEKFDGRSMVEVSKSILKFDYEDSEYDESFFSVFNLLVDEGGEKNADYAEIETLYRNSFVNALSAFRTFYRI